MSYSPELSQPEVPQLRHLMKTAGAWALAGVLVAGGATIATAYNDLRQGVDGSVFDIHHAETHALDTSDAADSGDEVVMTDPAQFNTAHLYVETIG